MDTHSIILCTVQSRGLGAHTRRTLILNYTVRIIIRKISRYRAGLRANASEVDANAPPLTLSLLDRRVGKLGRGEMMSGERQAENQKH